MTDDRIREVLDRYETWLTEYRDWHPDADRIDADWIEPVWFEHLLTMIPKMRAMLDVSPVGDFSNETLHAMQAHREKLMRWLGFLQGALWVKGIYTIDELKAHNRPDGDG